MGKRDCHGERSLTRRRSSVLRACGRLDTERPQSTTTAIVFPLTGLENAGKTDVQLKANVEKQDRAKCGKNDSGWMKSSGCRVRKHVGNRAADDRSDHAEPHCPETRPAPA